MKMSTGVGSAPMESRVRTRFLTEVWAAYPAAEAGWLDVSHAGARFDSSEKASVIACGRLRGLGDRNFELTSNGRALAFKISDTLRWMRPQKHDSVPSEEIFKDGDIVAVSLTGSTTRIVANEVLLLCPTQDDGFSVSAFDVGRSRLWSSFVAHIRNYFTARDFIEAVTPTLVPSPGTEPFLDPFRTEWEIGSTKREFFLPTSPEFHLKKLLSRGWTRVFEFKTCFRNGEIGEHHQPEFTMLEWYRAFENLDAIADDSEELLRGLVERFSPNARLTFTRTTMRDLFREKLDFDLTPATTIDELKSLATRTGIAFGNDDSWNDIFFRVFLEKIERSLGENGPCLVRGYPPGQAALSRIGADGFADRFEIYWHGLEIANAFHELNDPTENVKRFSKDAEEKAALRKPPVPRDEELVRALRRGMPPSGGIALGVDRLFMALFDIKNIEDTRAFPVRPQP
jgi:lysyl-tRNA synthetase class 2